MKATSNQEEKQVERARKRILKVLFLSSEPLSSYQIAKKAGVSQAASHKILEEMLGDGVVKIVKTEKYRTNLEAKYYTLTKKGLEEALKNIAWKKVSLEEIERALDYWAEVMPEVEALFWWKVFRNGSEPVKKFYIACLSSNGFLTPLFTICALSNLVDKIARMSAEEVFSMDLIYTAQFIGIWYDFMQSFKPEELQRLREELAQLAKANEEMRKEIIEILEEYHKEHQETLKDIERLLSFFKQ